MRDQNLSMEDEYKIIKPSFIGRNPLSAEECAPVVGRTSRSRRTSRSFDCGRFGVALCSIHTTQERNVQRRANDIQ